MVIHSKTSIIDEHVDRKGTLLHSGFDALRRTRLTEIGCNDICLDDILP
jgi:hypothetical protein